MKRLSQERLAWYRSQRAPLGGWTELLGHIEAVEAALERERLRGDNLATVFGIAHKELAEARVEIARLKEQLDQQVCEVTGGSCWGGGGSK